MCQWEKDHLRAVIDEIRVVDEAALAAEELMGA